MIGLDMGVNIVGMLILGNDAALTLPAQSFCNLLLVINKIYVFADQKKNYYHKEDRIKL